MAVRLVLLFSLIFLFQHSCAFDMHLLNLAAAIGIPISAFLAVASAHPFPASGKHGRPDIVPLANLFRRQSGSEKVDNMDIQPEGSGPTRETAEKMIAGLTHTPGQTKFIGTESASCTGVESLLDAENGEVQPLVGLDAMEHVSLVSCLIHRGYKPISLSSYGSPIQYSSVWAMEPHGELEYIQDADYAIYSAWLSMGRDNGYISTFVTAMGEDSETALFSGVMEKIESQSWTQICDIEDLPAVQDLIKGYTPIIVDLAAYGSPLDRKYCVLAHENKDKLTQTGFLSTVEKPNFLLEYLKVLEEETTKPFWHPTRQYLSESHEYSAFFKNTHHGKWHSFQKLPLNELKNKIKSMKDIGLLPIDIQGGGTSTDDIIYNVIFAEHTSPKPKKLTARGKTIGFQDNDVVTTSIDALFKKFMESNNVRQIQFSAAVKGKVIMERAYTFAEDSYPTVNVDSRFMIGSLSKIFLNAAIDKLIGWNMLQPNTKVYEVLGYKEFADKRSRDITVQHLLEYQGGFESHGMMDPSITFRQIALDLGLDHAATLRDVIDYMVKRPLDFTPGTKTVFGNYGHMLLSQLVATVANMDYYELLRDYILNSANVKPYATGYENHVSENYLPESAYVGPDPRIVDREVIIPSVFGGDGSIKEETMGALGLAASASAVARFLGTHAIRTMGGHEYGAHEGSVPGAQVFAQCRADDIDIVILANTREFEASSWERLTKEWIPGVLNAATRKSM